MLFGIMLEVARPRGFEPLTFAFGGQYPRLVASCCGLRDGAKIPVGS
jgi:hypothetical protein